VAAARRALMRGSRNKIGAVGGRAGAIFSTPVVADRILVRVARGELWARMLQTDRSLPDRPGVTVTL